MDTVCAQTFRLEIAKASSAENGCLTLQLAKLFNKDDIVDFFDVFMVGIKLVLFSIQHLSGQMQQLATCRLVNLRWGRTESDAQLFDYSDNLGVEFAAQECAAGAVFVWLETDTSYGAWQALVNDAKCGKTFVSLGKTSELTLLDQVCWQSTTHAVETVFYCHVDAMLTLALTQITKDLMEIVLNSNFLETYPFKILQTPSGQKVNTHTQ